MNLGLRSVPAWLVNSPPGHGVKVIERIEAQHSTSPPESLNASPPPWRAALLCIDRLALKGREC